MSARSFTDRAQVIVRATGHGLRSGARPRRGTFVAVDQHTTFLEDYFSFLSIDPLLPVPKPPWS